MDRETARLMIARGLAFAGTLIFSLVIVNGLPRYKQQRQQYFAEAIVDGNLLRMQWLRTAGANVNARGNCCLPLYLAAAEGRIEVVRYLLDQDADVNAREKLGDTALTKAAYNGHLVIVKELLCRGADVNTVGKDGTALDIAIERQYAAIADLLRQYGAKRACEMRR